MKRRPGLTLIELITVIAILAIIGGTALLIFVSAQRSFYSQQSTGILQSDIHIALDRMTALARQGRGVLQTYNGPPLYTTGSGTLAMELPAIDANGTIIASTYDVIVFTVDEGTLVREIFPGTGSSRPGGKTTLLTQAEMIVRYYDPTGAEILNAANYLNTDRVHVMLTAQEVVRDDTNTVTLETYAKLRNR